MYKYCYIFFIPECIFEFICVRSAKCAAELPVNFHDSKIAQILCRELIARIKLNDKHTPLPSSPRVHTFCIFHYSTICTCARFPLRRDVRKKRTDTPDKRAKTPLVKQVVDTSDKSCHAIEFPRHRSHLQPIAATLLATVASISIFVTRKLIDTSFCFRYFISLVTRDVKYPPLVKRFPTI